MLKLTKGTKFLITVLVIISAAVIIYSINYYTNVNSLEDPRTLHIKQLHLKYNDAVRNNDVETALSILDSMDRCYNSIPHYENSFERGVINIDKSAVYINYALYRSKTDEEKSKFLDVADSLLNLSEVYYSKWERDYKGLSDQKLTTLVSSDFSELNAEDKDEIINKRIEDIKLALREIDRRYSVLYTNSAIVQRHKLNVDSAAVLYKKALDLWKDNHTAKSNLNVLMGGEPLERGVIDKLFPQER